MTKYTFYIRHSSIHVSRYTQRLQRNDNAGYFTSDNEPDETENVDICSLIKKT
jgi:hypothetical protein